ncbi:hypothetical protein [Desulfurivibrio sp. C05AmB]|uniref:hypothetical protein n=1 Tax=Desulfurivibrio sp. C05AmB TaxID=3374371 RepID=UPI00376EACBA
MPHFGLMDEKELGPVEGPLFRTRLHIRSGRRRLRQGKTAAGIATLADALSSAFQWYLAAHDLGDALEVRADDNLNDDLTVYQILVRTGVLDGAFDFEDFDLLVERALDDDTEGIDEDEFLQDLEGIMRQLGVMPFDEGALPAEDPNTY